MRTVWTFSDDEAAPDPQAILAGLGLALAPPARLLRLLEASRAEYAQLAAPRALVMQVSLTEFRSVYVGDDDHVNPTPLDIVAPRAAALFLFVATVGEAVSDRIAQLFAADDFALSCALDAAASAGAEAAARAAQRRCLGLIVPQAGASLAALDYSPGYCGWRLSGQRRLFARLQPAELGVRLTESCLMQPLKSLSGVIAVGPPEIHRFEPEFACCRECTVARCRSRLDAPPPAGRREQRSGR